MRTPTDLSDLGFQPDPSRPGPIYLQLAATLSNAIRQGRIAIGARLPSERLYAETLGVSRTTITAAYQELRAMGLLRGYVGRGAIVTANDPDGSPAEAVSWSQLTSRFARRYRSPSVGNNSGLISFGDGWLHSSLTPRAALTAAAANVVQDSDALTKAAPLLGLPALQDALIETLRTNGVKTSPGEMLITGGAQQGLNVIARALLSPGDTVVCESPTWHGAIRAFRAAGAEVAGVAMDHEGVDPDGLEDSIARLRPKFVYLIPTFQCPTGQLMGLQRRRLILEICARLRTPIVESHVYGDLAFGEKLPSLKSLDRTGLVIHQGSASKTISAATGMAHRTQPRDGCSRNGEGEHRSVHPCADSGRTCRVPEKRCIRPSPTEILRGASSAARHTDCCARGSLPRPALYRASRGTLSLGAAAQTFVGARCRGRSGRRRRVDSSRQRLSHR